MPKYPHQGDPCIYCNVPHNDVSPGPCIPRALKERYIDPNCSQCEGTGIIEDTEGRRYLCYCGNKETVR